MTYNMTRNILVKSTLFFTILIFLSTTSLALAQTKPTVFIDPKTTSTKPCLTFWISVKIKDVTDLNNYWMDLSYDTSQLERKDWNLGSFLGGGGGLAEPEPWGTITAFQSHKTEGGGSSGQGTLFQIKFHCKKVGSSELTLSDITLKDKNGDVIIDFNVENGKVTQGVGGIVVPINKFSLLAPYISLASTILVATATTAIYVKRVKRRETKNKQKNSL